MIIGFVRRKVINIAKIVGNTFMHAQPPQIFDYYREENVHTREITFHTVLVNGEPFTLRFSKSDFEGRDIKIWRSAIRHHETVKSPKFKQQDIEFSTFNKGAITDRFQILKEMIQNNGNKVRIYLSANVGEMTRDGVTISYGYQYVYSTLKPILPPTTTPSEARHFVLDLSKDGNGNYIDPQAEMKLQYVVALSMSYAPSVNLRYKLEKFCLKTRVDAILSSH